MWIILFDNATRFPDFAIAAQVAKENAYKFYTELEVIEMKEWKRTRNQKKIL